jgi:hypothetical protein
MLEKLVKPGTFVRDAPEILSRVERGESRVEW